MNWQELSDSDRSSAKSEYAAAGISLIVSAFGSTEAPTTSGEDPTSLANTMAAWVQQYDLDGIDVDYEVCSFSPYRVPTPGLTFFARTSTP